MSKKVLLALAGVVVLVAALGAWYIFSSRQRQTGNVAGTLPSPIAQSPSAEQDLTYNDSSGFSFDYPASLKIVDVTPTDYYSLLNISKGNGQIKITVKDGKASEVSFGQADLMGATTLAGISAKQYQDGNNLVTAAYDAGIVYLIEGPKDGGYWENAQNTIVSTFAFTGSGSSASAGTGSGDITVEEEIVQ